MEIQTTSKRGLTIFTRHATDAFEVTCNECDTLTSGAWCEVEFPDASGECVCLCPACADELSETDGAVDYGTVL